MMVITFILLINVFFFLLLKCAVTYLRSKGGPSSTTQLLKLPCNHNFPSKLFATPLLVLLCMLMIPAWTHCPTTWTKEYAGYTVMEHKTQFLLRQHIWYILHSLQLLFWQTVYTRVRAITFGTNIIKIII